MYRKIVDFPVDFDGKWAICWYDLREERRKEKSMHPFVPLTEEQHNALTGNMLGDGCLVLGKRNAHLVIGRAIKDLEYLQYEMSIFDDFLSPNTKKYGATIKDKFDKRTNKTTQECIFGTKACPSFTPYYELWYGSGKKKVSNDLELNAQIIAHWIADDGHLCTNKLPYRFVLELSTHGFAENEVCHLAKLLSERYSEEFLVKKKTRKNKKTGLIKEWFIIKAYDSACRAMFKDIDPYFKMTRKRIWDAPDARFYSDPPERQKEIKKGFRRKEKKLARILNKEKEISIRDLSERIGSSRQVINNMLKPYFEAGKIERVERINKSDTNKLIKIRIIK